VAEVNLLRIIQEALTNIRRHAQARRVTLALAQEGDRLRMTVEDDGVGFDLTQSSLRGAGFAVARNEAKQSHPMQEIASAQTTGLAMTPHEAEGAQGVRGEVGHFGLANMHARAAELGGSLVIESALGQGTRLILECPIQAPGGTAATSAHPLRVLLVDDHPMFLDGLRGLLTAHGMEVVGLGQDGLEAQTLARALRPDLIVMDLQMPNCDGLEATRRIKAEWPEAVIVILTVSAQEEHLFAALQAGAAGYLLKSLNAEEFFLLLAGLEQGAPPIAPELAARIQGELGQAAAQRGQLAPLTPQQNELLRLVAQGKTYREVGRQLHLSEPTVKYHMKQILERLHLANRGQAAAYGRRSRLGGDEVTG
jgi:two-component system NarL family response regulator